MEEEEDEGDRGNVVPEIRRAAEAYCPKPPPPPAGPSSVLVGGTWCGWAEFRLPVWSASQTSGAPTAGKEGRVVLGLGLHSARETRAHGSDYT